MILKLILVIMMLVLIPNTSAELDDTKITISVQDAAKINDYIRVDGQLTYFDGSEITIGHMQIVRVHVFINGIESSGFTQCDASGNFWGLYKMDSVGATEIKVVFEGKPLLNLAGSQSSIKYVTVTDINSSPPDMSGLIKFISYAKGFFALVFFGVLSITIGTGCYSTAVHDPQKKANAQDGLFSLLKVLATVTCFYMAVLFLASA